MPTYSCPDCPLDHAKLADPCPACKRVAAPVTKLPRPTIPAWLPSRVMDPCAFCPNRYLGCASCTSPYPATFVATNAPEVVKVTLA